MVKPARPKIEVLEAFWARIDIDRRNKITIQSLPDIRTGFWQEKINERAARREQAIARARAARRPAPAFLPLLINLYATGGRSVQYLQEKLLLIYKYEGRTYRQIFNSQTQVSINLAAHREERIVPRLPDAPVVQPVGLRLDNWRAGSSFAQDYVRRSSRVIREVHIHAYAQRIGSGGFISPRTWAGKS
jgi:hypothetical protein